jgi:aryl-alcohol dehydrogenase-like predicted oxidoreductase
MKYRNYGNTEVKVSSIGLGCVTFGREIDEETSFAILDRAAERGINILNTSYYYGDGSSEQVMGNYFSARNNRDKFVIVTKIHGDLSPKTVFNCAEESLRRLKTDYVDFFEIAYDVNTPFQETLGALEKLVKEGKVRHVGCNNYSDIQMAEALQIQRDNGFSTIQSLEAIYSLAIRGIEDKVVPFCEKENIGIISYSPLGAGFLTGKYRKGKATPKGTRFDVKPGHKNIYFKKQLLELDGKLEAISERTGFSRVQLALRWVLEQPGITSMLIGARNTDHVDQAFDAEACAITPEIIDELSVLSNANRDTL